ncbi:hypothetical protein, partial [Lacticaseibacillus paracasei]|uniref:hypothetical protein n=1 Tax=Lacticaseibacillus paracasei TaxID=1597 RepID=UPI0040465901
AHAITTDAWRNSLDHYQEFVIIVALDLKIEEQQTFSKFEVVGIDDGSSDNSSSIFSEFRALRQLVLKNKWLYVNWC